MHLMMLSDTPSVIFPRVTVFPGSYTHTWATQPRLIRQTLACVWVAPLYRALLSHSHIQAFSAASCCRVWLSASGPQESLEREALCLVIGLQSLCSQRQRAGKWPCLDDVDRMIMSGISAVVKMTAGNSSCFSTSTSISPVTGCSQEACGRPLVYFGLWDTGRGVHLAPAEQVWRCRPDIITKAEWGTWHATDPTTTPSNQFVMHHYYLFFMHYSWIIQACYKTCEVSFSLMYILTKEIIEQSPWQLILVYV